MLSINLIVITAGRGAVVEDNIAPGAVDLVGIHEIIGGGVIDIRSEPFVQAGVSNSGRDRRGGFDTILRVRLPRRGSRSAAGP